MARPAPAVDRAADILDFLAAHPRDAFSLSELARRLELNKASAHAVLGALVDRGYLLRHPSRKDYALGPRLIAVGTAAREQYPALDFARDEIRRLADDLSMEVVASAAVGAEMVILDRAGPIRPIGLSVAVGHRFPLIPPMGTVFMAWAPATEIDRWLTRVGPGATTTELDGYRQALAAVRARGFSAGLDADASRALGQALEQDKDADFRQAVGDLRHDEYQLLELAGEEEYRLNHLSAPVFDPDGEVVLAINIVGFRGALSADQVPDYAERLRKATTAVTESIQGLAPTD